MIPSELNEALDIETAPEHGYPGEYALQPWRVLEGTAHITVVALGRATGAAKLQTEDFGSILKEREGKPTCGWNLTFDIAFLIAAGHYEAVNKIPWYDAMLLWKWYENGVMKERMPKWSLVDGAKRWLKDWPLLGHFLELKATERSAGVDKAYWELRGKLDAVVTAMISQRIWAKLSPKKRQSATIEMQCLVPLARSWVMGVPMAPDRIQDAAPLIVEEMQALEVKLGVSDKTLGSPKQLGVLLFELWCLEPIPGHITDGTKNKPAHEQVPSTDKKHLTYLAEKDDRVLNILRWRHLNTQKSKFIEAPQKAFEYLGSNVVHPSPKLFSTYTGRMTYSSKIKSKFPAGVALHQWQRDKVIRSLIKAPEGYALVEYDASGQEDRLMAEVSQDTMLLKIFKDDMDIHCYTAASITGRGYEELMEMKATGDKWLMGDGTGSKPGMRMAGKVTNHSNKYRIGANKMRITAKVPYGMTIDVAEARRWQSGFHRSFPGIKRYWGSAIHRAKTLGYAETLGGRTFLTPESFFKKEDQWSTESSSINFPIQGAGADMKELAIATVHAKHPGFLFAFDLHDGLFYYVQRGTPMQELRDVQHTLDNLDYMAAWGYQPSIPLTWDGEFGPDWGHMSGLNKATQEYL
jgi:DNA polymerase I-like protein with 3'-5' exonuclease and polymerase domains